MIEHRLIERVIGLVSRLAAGARARGGIDPQLVAACVDFIRVYADRTHHGKEEDILFRALGLKKMSDGDAGLMAELVEEHKVGRRVVGELVGANESYRGGNAGALAPIIAGLEQLAAFYPAHISKEDKVFFPASMKYLDKSEKDAMLEEMAAFDARMIHEKYSQVVKELLERETGTAR
jgi:hemerythrin-like domain-containing protein